MQHSVITNELVDPFVFGHSMHWTQSLSEDEGAIN